MSVTAIIIVLVLLGLFADADLFTLVIIGAILIIFFGK